MKKMPSEIKNIFPGRDKELDSVPLGYFNFYVFKRPRQMVNRRYASYHRKKPHAGGRVRKTC